MVLNGFVGREESQQNRNSYGVSIGIVTSNRDPEGRGRIKVNLPWRGENDESYWARIASPMAGKGRGFVFYPEVGDEVLLAFEQGDINHPYVIGALWNGRDEPPEPNADGKNNIRKIRSRSGHEIIFNDNDTGRQEKIEIHTRGGHRIILDDSAGQEKIEVSDKSGNNKIIIDSVKDSIIMESAVRLTLKASVVEIEGTASLTLKSNAALNIQGLPVKIN